MSLDCLTPELLALILQALDSPRDLHRLISASPSCFRTFSHSPELVLSSVIKHALLGENIRHALAIIQAPSTSDQIPPFLDNYFNPIASFAFPTTKADLLLLYRLYNRLCYLLDEYFEKTLQEMGLLNQQPRSYQSLHQDAIGECGGRAKKQDQTSSIRSMLLPSLSERTRMQRAFLRFGLYCRVFPSHESDPYGSTDPPPSDHPSNQQFSLFISNLTPWEVEEICCIEQYFSFLVGESMDELEEELVNAVMAAPGVVLPTPSLPKSQSSADEPPSQDKSDQGNLVDFKNLDLTDLMLFCRDGRHSSPRYISYIISLGLDFMYSLTTSDRVKRWELIRSNHPVTREFLPEALSHAPSWTTGPQFGTPTAEHGVAGNDDPSYCNLGYRLFKKTPESALYMGILDSFQYAPLRKLGYVFWDSNRIQSPEVSKKLSAANNMELYERNLLFDRRDKKTAEDRLKGTRLPREQMNRIEQEFGSTLLGD